MLEDNPKQWPDAFLEVKIGSMDGHFVFTDDPKFISHELIKVIEEIAE